MSINLIDILRNSFTEKSYQDIAEHVGINPESVKNGLNALVPSVLVCILGNNTVTSSTQPTWWNALKDEYPYSEDEYIETKNITTPAFLIKGREVLSGMFRTNHDELVKSVGSVAGVPKEKAAGLIEVGVPLIIGYLSNWLRKKNWKFKDLIENLIDTKMTIVGELPVGISSAQFGINSEVNNLPKNNFSDTIETHLTKDAKDIKKGRNGLWWILGLLALALLLWYFLGNRACVRNMQDDLIVPGVKDTIAQTSFQEQRMDGTFYAYKTKP